MALASSGEQGVADAVAELQRQLGKKATFEAAVRGLTALVERQYEDASAQQQEAVSDFGLPN